jgi:patatin-like phospholipase/acyl hydrolase
MSVQEKLDKAGPRKLLALDGGGIRGVMSVEVLAEIERRLQEALGRDDTFVLADYFDYFAGTSTGAIIAACLAMGMRTDRVRDFYVDSGKQMFEKSRWYRKPRYLYEDEPLANLLKEVLGEDTQLGSDKVQTLLLMIMRNASTDSPWPVSNNPHAKYNQPGRPDCNLKFPLWQLVRASTAAPVFFPPELIQVGDYPFIFVDGGVTMYNNPAFQLLLMATTEPYNLNWPTGEDAMLMISIGTGGGAAANVNLRPDEMNILYNASSIPSALMGAASVEQDFLCRAFGKCVVGEQIDREVLDMIGKHGPGQSKLFTYARLNADLSRAGLNALGLNHIEPSNVQKLDSVEYIPQLQEVGQAVAEQKVRPNFDAVFGSFLS